MREPCEPGPDPRTGGYRLPAAASRGLPPVDPPCGRRRVFASTEHLAPDAIVAFVDGGLSRGATERAIGHLRECPRCQAEIETQRDARARLRGSGPVTAPQNLRDVLSRIGHQGTDECAGKRERRRRLRPPWREREG